MLRNVRDAALPLFLCASLILASCAPSVVQIRPPYPDKVRPGDGVKVSLKSGKEVSGRVTYVDGSVMVVRTPKQTVSETPVKETRFGTTITWPEVTAIKVAGTLDSTSRLISNEEIRINHRTNHRRNFTVNLGLLGSAAAFLIASSLQDQVASPFDPSKDHARGRATFWTTWLLGSTAAATGGYYLGRQIDRSKAIQRIERLRAQLRRSTQDSMRASYSKSVFGTPLEHPPR